VFGSVAAGAPHGESDIDIAVGFSGDFSDLEKQDACLDSLVEPIASAVNVAAEKIDIKNFVQLPLSVRFRVIRNGKLVYLKDVPAQRARAVQTMGEYDDEKPFFDMANRAFFQHYVTKNV
jgi:predicted nucleotidyltransferase